MDAKISMYPLTFSSFDPSTEANEREREREKKMKIKKVRK